MPVITLIAALLLIVIGTIGYATGTPGADGAVSPTALIPAGFGGVIGLCGALALTPSLRKHAMHAAAALALLGVVGGLMPLIRSGDPSKPAAVWGLLMSAICAALVALCVKSFVDARKARTAATLADPVDAPAV